MERGRSGFGGWSCGWVRRVRGGLGRLEGKRCLVDIGERHAEGAGDQGGWAEVGWRGAIDERAQGREDRRLDLSEHGVLIGGSTELRFPWWAMATTINTRHLDISAGAPIATP